MIPKPKLIVLDRDGVINVDSDAFIKSADEWHAITGSLEAIAKLNKAGIKVAIATNQSGVGRGLFSLAILDEIHRKLKVELGTLGGHIDYLCFCPHHPNDNCDCRKPKPGMINKILTHFNCQASDTLVIGDSLRDLQAAKAANCPNCLVKTGKGEITLKNLDDESRVDVFTDLADVVGRLLR